MRKLRIFFFLLQIPIFLLQILLFYFLYVYFFLSYFILLFLKSKPRHTCDDQRYSHELVLSFHHVGLRDWSQVIGFKWECSTQSHPVLQLSTPLLSSIFALHSEMVIEERFLLLLINWLSEMKWTSCWFAHAEPSMLGLHLFPRYVSKKWLLYHTKENGSRI